MICTHNCYRLLNLFRTIKEVGDPALRFKAEELVRAKPQLAILTEHRYHGKAPSTLIRQHKELELPIHDVVQIILPDLPVVLCDNVFRLLIGKLLRIAGAVVDIPLPPLQILQEELQGQVRHVAGDEAPNILPVQAVDQRLFLVGMGERRDHIGERRLVMGNLHIRITEFAVLEVLDGAVQANQLQLVQLVARALPAGGLYDLPRDKLLQGLTENVNPAGLASEPEDGVVLKLVLFIWPLNKLPDNAVDVCP